MDDRSDILKADLPFDGTEESADADITLRSSDGVHFFVHRIVLALASPVFKDILSIPHHSSVHLAPPEDYREGKPVIAVTEDRTTLLHFLECLYPACSLRLKTRSSRYVAAARSIRCLEWQLVAWSSCGRKLNSGR